MCIRDRFNSDPPPEQQAAAAAACCVSFDSTRTHTGSLHTPAVATIQQTSPHVHSTTAVGTKGQGRGLPPRRELAAQDLVTLGAFGERRLAKQRNKNEEVAGHESHTAPPRCDWWVNYSCLESSAFFSFILRPAKLAGENTAGTRVLVIFGAAESG